MIERGLNIKPEVYISALNSQKIISEVLNKKFLNFDAVISISTSTIAPLLNVEETIDPSLIWTLAGLPSINIPLSCYKKMPYGFQAIAAKYKDYNLLEVINDFARNNIIRSTSISPEFLKDK